MHKNNVVLPSVSLPLFLSPISFPSLPLSLFLLQDVMRYMAGVRGGGGGGGGYAANFRCFPMAMLPSASEQKIAQVDLGGKLMLPSSALDRLTRLNIEYPMLFSVHNRRSGRNTHCGVLEFVADEGLAHMPHWMMQNLVLAEGDQIAIRNVKLPVATYARFKAQHVSFLEIGNHKAVLERSLRTFACLTEGDIIAISYNDRIYEILVEEVRRGFLWVLIISSSCSSCPWCPSCFVLALALALLVLVLVLLFLFCFFLGVGCFLSLLSPFYRPWCAIWLTELMQC